MGRILALLAIVVAATTAWALSRLRWAPAAQLTGPRPRRGDRAVAVLRRGVRLTVSAPVRWGTAIVLLVWAAPGLSYTADSKSLAVAALTMSAAVVLLAPDLLRAVEVALPRTRSVTLMSRRLLAADRGRTSLAVVALAATVALPVSSATFTATQQRSEEAANQPFVPPRTIVSDYQGPTRDQVMQIIGDTGVSPPVEVGILQQSTPAGATVRFGVSKGRGSYAIYVVRSLADLQRITDAAISPQAHTALESGAVADFSGVTRQRLQFIDANGVTSFSEELPTVPLQVSDELRTRAAGAVLESTIGDLGLTTMPYELFYTGLSDEQILSAASAVKRAGIDISQLQYYTDPPPTRLATEWYIVLICFSAAAAALVWLAIASQVAHLRRYTARLLAIGLPRGWGGQVQLVQIGLIALSAILVAVPAAALPILMLVRSAPDGLVLDIPLRYIALAVGLVAGVLTAATLTSVSRLTADTRPAR